MKTRKRSLRARRLGALRLLAVAGLVAVLASPGVPSADPGEINRQCAAFVSAVNRVPREIVIVATTAMAEAFDSDGDGDNDSFIAPPDEVEIQIQNLVADATDLIANGTTTLRHTCNAVRHLVTGACHTMKHVAPPPAGCTLKSP